MPEMSRSIELHSKRSEQANHHHHDRCPGTDRMQTLQHHSDCRSRGTGRCMAPGTGPRQAARPVIRRIPHRRHAELTRHKGGGGKGASLTPRSPPKATAQYLPCCSELLGPVSNVHLTRCYVVRLFWGVFASVVVFVKNRGIAGEYPLHPAIYRIHTHWIYRGSPKTPCGKNCQREKIAVTMRGEPRGL